MNCDFCNGQIPEAMQVSWNKGNYHPGCVGEAVLKNRVQTEVPTTESNLPEDYFEQLDEEYYDNETTELEEDDFESEFEKAIDQLDTEPITPEVVESDYSVNAVVEVPTGAIIAAPRAVIIPPQKNGTLIAGEKGSKFVTFPELKNLPVPETTSTFKPVPFYDFVTKVLDGLYDRRMRTVDEQYIISADGMKLFGLIELENEYDGVRFAVGLRSSNDKSMKLALACGYKVMCCSNGMLSGDFMPLAVKHSANLDIDDALALGIDRIRRRFGHVQQDISEKRLTELTDTKAESLIYKAFTYGKFPVSLFRTVHKEYFIEPSYKEFAPRTLFSLENAFTTSFKKLQPMQQFEQTSRFAKFLQEHKN